MWKKHQNQREERLEERNSLHRLHLFFILLAFALKGFCKSPHFTFTPSLLKAQLYNYELKIVPARSILEAEQVKDPSNGVVDYLLHFNHFLEVFIAEEKPIYKKYTEVKSASLINIENLPDSLPYKKFALSEFHFYSAVLKGKFNELYAAARELNKANSLIEDNHKRFPKFIQNNKTRGILKVYLSTVPENYAWAVKLLGIQGNLIGGLRLLKQLADADYTGSPELKYISKETSYIYSFALSHVAKQSNLAWAETLKATNDYETNAASAYFRSTLALKLNKNETAINVLKNRPSSTEYYPFYFLDYQLGSALLYKQDKSAEMFLKKYLKEFKGRNYIKSCNQKLSWYYLLDGQLANYKKYRNQILRLGESITEEDKLAIRYTKKPTPNRYLLQARLLYDGGYYAKALEASKKVNSANLTTKTEKAEYCYRKGRILEKLGEYEIAMQFYEACSLFAVNSTEYYGAYACLYIADYHLKNGNKVNSKTYYTKALTFNKNKEYVGSIEQRARVGLKKIK